MDKISLLIIIDKLTNISDLAYHGTIDSVDISFRIDAIIDELRGFVDFCE